MNAKLLAEDVVFTKVQLDDDHGRKVYEVEFYSDSTEYDYEVGASDGKIKSYEIDSNQKDAIISTATNNTNSNAGSTKENNDTASYMDIQSTKDIALRHTGMKAADVIFTKEKLDKEDGTVVYKIEFLSGQIEYDYEINALTGGIIDFSIEQKEWN